MLLSVILLMRVYIKVTPCRFCILCISQQVLPEAVEYPQWYLQCPLLHLHCQLAKPAGQCVHLGMGHVALLRQQKPAKADLALTGSPSSCPGMQHNTKGLSVQLASLTAWESTDAA